MMLLLLLLVWLVAHGSAVFTRLSTLCVDDRSLDAGSHLVCVYGDNFLQKTYFSRKKTNTTDPPTHTDWLRRVALACVCPSVGRASSDG